MKKILAELKKELFYQWFSNMIIVSLSVIIALSVFNIFTLNKSVFNQYNIYTQTLKHYKDNGLDINKDLSTDYKINTENNIEEIDNILRYDFDAVSNSIEDLNPINSVNSNLSYLTFVFLPIIWGIYGAIVGSYDFKYKTLKIRSILSKNKNILLSKQLSITIVIIVNTIISVLIFSMLSFVLYSSILSNNILKEFITFSRLNIVNSILQILFSIITSIIFSNIGLVIGMISKNALIASLTICLYNLLIPNLGVYDFKNLIMNLGGKIYTFNESFQLSLYYPIDNNFIYIIFIFIFTFILTLFCKWFKKTSKFN
ncbi:MAG: hypothetical protein RR712_05230 [Terrisporobacter sp.]